MPEWMVVVAFFALLALVGLVWSPMQWAVVPFVASAGIWLWQAVRTSLSGKYQVKRSSGAAYIKRVVVTTWLAMIYPLARLSGRIKGGLTPLRVAGNAGKSSGVNLPLVKRADYWDGDVSDSFQRLTLVKKFINQLDIGVRTGGDYDPWDLEVRGGIAGGARLSLMVEHHGEQLSRIRYRVVQRFNGIWIFAAAIMLFYSMFLVLTSSPVAGILTLGFLALLIYKGINDSGHAATVLTRAVSHKEVAKAAPVAHDSDISCIQEESESVAA